MPSGTFNLAEMYGIVRGPGRHWIVSLTRNGIHANQIFSFSKWGGHDAALASAQAWRDAFVRNNPQLTRQELATRLRSNNKSGIPGVIPIYGPDGEIRKWKAQTYMGGGGARQNIQKSFGVTRYGEAEAKRLAIAERQKQLEQLRGRRSYHPADQSKADLEAADSSAPD
ncbi:AP2 domain-containing protein [Variovorax sp. JS1663]|uniref:AP2 domain-containing protein n=1 Tax=Variovorax sp. JS1663 TaxID=1851577 RepID=UPI000B34A126|nr:AP2 domain-containing protein [Variovorax sp. JS1663]OUL98891.1 hypothetical protein A8M77_29390 [Variovorax sp. JS1663]